VSDLYPQILEKDHEISFSGEDLKMRADAFTFKTLLQNLIGNAIKYTPDQGKISVTLQYDAHDIVLTVSDSGPGIAPSERDRIFDRFYRVGGDQHQSQVIGCGLGLSIVKHIADLYQAKIALAQSEWGGLAISLRFTQDIQFKEKTFV
jgi:two-component system sensor histidine kinase QseC